jgi:propionyl-CoA carboxylase beta chain
VYRQEIAAASNPQELREKKIQEFKEKFANPFVAAERGFVDDVILPRESRPRLIAAFRMLENKVDRLPKKKHGNIPL